MCFADSNHQRKNQVHSYLRQSLVLIVCLICVSGTISLAQAGRKQNKTEAANDSAKSSQADRNDKKEQQSASNFIVITAPPDFIPEHLSYLEYSQPQNFEYLARRGFQLELKTLPGANVVEDENLPRWEARETALAEDDAWVIWMELKWEKTIPVNGSPFRLRYLLFEPQTGKLVASGFGKGIRQTWGLPARNTTLQEQIQEAGRNIAEQAISEIRKRSEN